MMKFTVATNWDDRLIEEIGVLDPELKVIEIFGKLATDFIGGGRTPYALTAVSKKKAAGHIKLVKQGGRKFNYLLNASCLDNREFTRSGQKQIRNLLSWLDSIGVDVITVTNPYLGYLIKKEYPRFELSVSALVTVDNMRKINFWLKEIGADKITLDSYNINRNFPLLKRLCLEASCQLYLLANESCMYNCPFKMYHTNFVSHTSQKYHPLKGFGIDWYVLNCRHRLFTQPAELIKSNWIRPEDVGYYEDMGISGLKIVDRSRQTKQILLSLKAYLQRKFDGNLMDLLFPMDQLPREKTVMRSLKFFLRPLDANIFKLAKLKDLFSEIKIYIDNRKLDGFLDYFLEGKCKPDDCQKCGYCRNVAERAVKIDNGYKERIDKSFKEIINSLTTGDMFRYF